ncbi:MAG: S8 family serine peptidase, partial [Chitinophagaceae bacterium]|nr:S8 family serine peptidase [Anaerolineae bacterium]
MTKNQRWLLLVGVFLLLGVCSTNVALLLERAFYPGVAALPTRVTLSMANDPLNNTSSPEVALAPPVNILSTPVPQSNSIPNLPVNNTSPTNGQAIPVSLPLTTLSPQTSGITPIYPIAPERVIDVEVEAAIAQQGEVKVIILLNPPDNGGAAFDSQAEQEAVLESIGADGFQNADTFTSVAAISGNLTAEGLEALRNNDQIARVYIDQPTEVFAIPSAALIGADRVQTGLVNTTSYTGAGVQVAVVDTGVAVNLPSPPNSPPLPNLGPQVIGQRCFVAPRVSGGRGGCADGSAESASANPDGTDPRSFHGTNVASIITEVDGVAPDSQIVAVRVLDRFGRGTNSDWMHGLEWILQQNLSGALNVKVINLSLGTNQLYSTVQSCINDAVVENQVVQQLIASGVIIIAATGNQGSATGISSPACLPGVIAVGAVYDRAAYDDGTRQPGQSNYFLQNGGLWPRCADEAVVPDKVACFSNSNNLTDVLAPGVQIRIARTGGTGTSQAAPHVAGVAALMIQAAPDLSPATVEGIFRYTGPAVTDPRNQIRFRRVDAVAAVRRALDPDGDFVGCNDTYIRQTVGEGICEALVTFYQST